ncbi:Uma2 family endonuclease [Alkanindiges sp. WGS2144]|uniref:Uma2 family endonuclease n=1 Tax=Alkanindiges sp. WGS2144 TaxID=3366808 RepID=UPI00374FF80D
MPMLKQKTYMSEQDYLEGELHSDIKHEYIDGEVYVMSGAHANHNRIAGNVYRKLGNHLEGKPCQPYSSDMKVKVGSKYFYPDVMVECQEADGYFTESPILLVEVLSKSTRRHDKTFKRLAYLQIPTLQEYVLIEQDFVEIELWRRTAQSHWQQNVYYLGDDIYFASIDLSIAVADIYDRVKNTDMQEWLQKKADSQATQQSEQQTEKSQEKQEQN